MFFHPKNFKSENINPWFDILLHTKSIVCATLDSQCLEYLGYITLVTRLKPRPYFSFRCNVVGRLERRYDENLGLLLFLSTNHNILKSLVETLAEVRNCQNAGKTQMVLNYFEFIWSDNEFSFYEFSWIVTQSEWFFWH